MLASIVVLAALVGGCGRYAVRANEKRYLADPVMVFDNDPHEAGTVDHVRTNREAAAGGNGAGGGGCGCN